MKKITFVVLVLPALLYTACSTFSGERSPQSISSAQDLYALTQNGETHRRLVDHYIHKNAASNRPGIADKIRSSYNFECTLSRRLQRNETDDLQRIGLEQIRSSVDPFDPGTSLNALPNSTERSRAQDQYLCAESLRRTFLELPEEFIPIYFPDPDKERYYYLANFTHIDLAHAREQLLNQKQSFRSRLQNSPPVAADPAKLSAAQSLRVEFLDASGSEQFYVARIPKNVSVVFSEDVHMLWQKLPGPLGRKPVSHLQIRFFFDEPIQLVPQRISAEGPVGSSFSLDSMIFTTEANGLPRFNYDSSREYEKDKRVAGVDWNKGTYLNYYRFKSMDASLRDSYPKRPNARRAGFPLVQYKLSWQGLRADGRPLAEQSAKDAFLREIIDLGLLNGSHIPYNLLNNNCAVGVFAALDNALHSPQNIRDRKTPLSRLPLVAVPWETHHAYQLRHVLARAPQRDSLSTVSVGSALVANVPSEGVSEYCSRQSQLGQLLDLTGIADDVMGICSSFGYLH